jgi:hypothetical protein
MQSMRTRWRPLLSVVAFGLVSGVLLTPVGMAHLDLVPDVCDRQPGPAQGGGDTGSAVLHASSSFDVHQHCFTCRWLQSFRSTLLSSGVTVLQASGVCQIAPVAAHATRSIARHSLPARAPPAASTPGLS